MTPLARSCAQGVLWEAGKGERQWSERNFESGCRFVYHPHSLLVGFCMKLTIFFITAVLSTILSDPAHAMSQWDKLNNEVESLYQKGDYNRAISVAKTALQATEREQNPAPPAVGTSLNSLALLYNAEVQYAQAEPLF